MPCRKRELRMGYAFTWRANEVAPKRRRSPIRGTTWRQGTAIPHIGRRSRS